MGKPLQTLAVGAAIVAAPPAWSQIAKPEDAAKYRQPVMFLQVKHLGRINGRLKSDKPNLQVIAENAAVLDTVNRLFFAGFTPGSNMVANSRAKPEIWTDQAKFKHSADKLNAEVAALVTASEGRHRGDEERVWLGAADLQGLSRHLPARLVRPPRDRRRARRSARAARRC
ncbi:MAG: c-type cytochrome [Gemmatimonadota bacterium]